MVMVPRVMTQNRVGEGRIRVIRTINIQAVIKRPGITDVTT